MNNDSVLLVIDAQVGINTPDWGVRSQPDAEQNIARLLQAFRQADQKVIHVQHDALKASSPLWPGTPGHAFMPEAVPASGEPIFNKTVNSAFIGTTLEAYLREHDLNSLVVAGFTTDHCISTSVRMAGNLGFDVTVIADATGTHERRDSNGTHFSAETIHATALASLHDEFARITTTEAFLLAS
ncbi:MAG: cysteine hydrolase family protein [Pseudomonadota bacterium]